MSDTFHIMARVARIRHIDIRSLWPHEEDDFTPWLGSHGGLLELGRCVGLDLRWPETEVRAGAFKADIVCEFASSGRPDGIAVIENQLERSDHGHLGQLLTYGAQLEAKAMIWVAPDFASEHLDAVTCLNELAQGSAIFFCVEVSALEIVEDFVAPSFDLLVSPDANPPKATPEYPRNSVVPTYQRFWSRLSETMRSRCIVPSRTSIRRDYQRFEFNPQHSQVCLSVIRDELRFLVRLDIRGGEHEALLHSIAQDRQQIESALGGEAEWTTTDRRSTVDIHSQSNCDDESTWDVQIDWTIGRLRLLSRVFSPRVAQWSHRLVSDERST